MSKKCYIPNVKYPVLKTGNHWECQEFKKGEHNGEDLLNRTPSTKNVACSIIAIDDGIVTVVKKTKTRGNYVEIKHDLGISRYLHMKDKSIKVSVGQKVKRGDVLGTMGTTGDSTGIHLHLAILIHGEYVDPYEFIIGLKILNLKEGKKEDVIGNLMDIYTFGQPTNESAFTHFAEVTKGCVHHLNKYKNDNQY